ncbi:MULTISPECIES: hypothetical protein [unclassified Bradyrhizobium]|uniref:hypothetical protein n=1 Tax=unclassified Bradyrhizobium TaxID=2631580 RepID=UPI0024794E4F|nr:MULTISPECIES: hypothetical protein [unclassified Bradyrhizobium]WGS18215.1 hypothetical protein MTX22_26985 [Bradyrhizobium sp. ISRA463]WGS25029.1 hypothetical protein MTX19_24605 [Bradyrhizobium sp. ISRA464]
MAGWVWRMAIAAAAMIAAGIASAEPFPTKSVHIQRLGKLGAIPIGSTPATFDAKIHADYEKWGPIIKAAGMTAE